VKDRPMLYQGEMVRSILADRKTQTRRVAKLTSSGHVKEVGGHRRWHPADPEAVLACPYGQPGDRLWVREAWHDNSGAYELGKSQPVYYRADYHNGAYDTVLRWKPSIHMPRWASRIALEITSRRLEHLQAISDADAIAEGIERGQGFPGWYRGPLEGDSPGLKESGERFKIPTSFPKLAYRALWEHINGIESWAANPLVWVVEFKRVMGGAS
jgi:hypothetical protein